MSYVVGVKFHWHCIFTSGIKTSSVYRKSS